MSLIFSVSGIFHLFLIENTDLEEERLCGDRGPLRGDTDRETLLCRLAELAGLCGAPVSLSLAEEASRESSESIFGP